MKKIFSFTFGLLFFLLLGATKFAIAGACSWGYYLVLNDKLIAGDRILVLNDTITITEGDTLYLGFSWTCGGDAYPTSVDAWFYKDNELMDEYHFNGNTSFHGGDTVIHLTKAGIYRAESIFGHAYFIVKVKKREETAPIIVCPLFWGVNIYPNPVHDELHLGFNFQEVTEVNYSIYNISGEKLIERQLTVDGFKNEDLDIAELASGFYIVAFNYGKERVILKFIKS